MAFSDFRFGHNSFQVDDSDSDDMNQSQNDSIATTAQSATATNTPTTATVTMASTVTTSATTTRISAQIGTASPQTYTRGIRQDGVYHPNISMPGTPGVQIPRTMSQLLGNTAQQPPMAATAQGQQPDFSAIYRDPNFVATIANIFRGLLPQMAQNQPQQPPEHDHDGQPLQRTSTPLNDRSQMLNSPTNLTQQMQNLQTVDTPRTPRAQLPPPTRLSSTPTYIPAAEQAFQIHKNSAEAARANADLFSGFAEFMSLMAQTHPNPPPAIPQMVHQFTQKAIMAEREATAKIEGLVNAQKITRHYETPIAKPAFPIVDHRRIIRVNHKELLMLTGYFDPTDKNSDFKHTWQKLLDYGSMNEFQEDHYMQALGSILKGEAYETFTEFKSMNKSLEEILDYFAGVYTKKRSLADDRRAVDEFTRKKGESIIVCMERAILAIDKLRYVYPASGWQALRQQMRHNILMQVVKEETKRAIQMEVDNVHEDTGMPYDFEKLIRFADRYERNHNSAPKEDLSTLFKVASGGLKRTEKRSSSQDQLAHLKKDQMIQKQISTLQAELKELKANEARLYKNEGRSDRARESRRDDRDSSRRQNRSASYDRNRNIDKPTTATTSTPTAARTSRPSSSSNTPTSVTYKPPDPYARREQSRSPSRRSQTPNDADYRRSSSYSRSRSRGRDQYRSNSGNRYDNRSSGSRTQSRSNSSGGTDHITSTGSKTVIITINGQDYVPLKKEN